MKGMENKASEVGAKIVGGQTVFNPWVVTGGSVLGVSQQYIVKNNKCEVGD